MYNNIAKYKVREVDMWLEASFGAILLTLSVVLLKKRVYRPSQEDSEDGVIVTYSKTIPGYEVKRFLGYIESTVVIPSDREVYASLGEQAVVEKLMDRAKELGANAILELKIEAEDKSTYTKFTARGLAVRV